MMNDSSFDSAKLITSCEQVGSAPTGYALSVEIITQTIQADGVDSNGEKTVVLAWGIQNGGSVTGFLNDETTGITGNTLTIKLPEQGG